MLADFLAALGFPLAAAIMLQQDRPLSLFAARPPGHRLRGHLHATAKDRGKQATNGLIRHGAARHRLDLPCASDDSDTTYDRGSVQIVTTIDAGVLFVLVERRAAEPVMPLT